MALREIVKIVYKNPRVSRGFGVLLFEGTRIPANKKQNHLQIYEYKNRPTDRFRSPRFNGVRRLVSRHVRIDDGEQVNGMLLPFEKLIPSP
ncbi:MAG: hypothetical protein WCO60_14695 [Verrucomicrobiota bacterium]